MTLALIQLIILLAPVEIELIQALLPVLVNALTVTPDVPTVAAVTAAIISGIDAAHPDWTAAERAQCASDAIAVYTAKVAGFQS